MKKNEFRQYVADSIEWQNNVQLEMFRLLSQDKSVNPTGGTPPSRPKNT